MNQPDASSASQRIARALARLRGPRSGGFGPGFGPPGFGGRGFAPGGRGGPHGAGHGRDAHDAPGRGPHRMGDHGPMGRFAAKFRLLDALLDAGSPLSVSEIGERIGVDQPRASRLVQACVDDGLVAREADASDARRTNVVLTETGRALVSRARGARLGAIDEALAALTEDEREQLAVLLTKLADAWPR